MKGPRIRSPSAKAKARASHHGKAGKPHRASQNALHIEMPEEEEEVQIDEAELQMAAGLRNIMDAPKKAFTFEELNRGRAVSMNEMTATTEFTYTKYYQQHREVLTKWFLTVARGISGKVKILHYELRDLVRCGGLYTVMLDGTIITMDKSTVFFLAFITAIFGLIFSVIWGTIGEGQHIETESLEAISQSLNSVVPFLLGTYVFLALERWWKIRYDGLGEVFNSIVNLQMVAGCILHGERNRPVRTLIMKWGFASIFLLMKAVRNNPSLTDMLYKCLLSEGELKILQEVDDLRGRPEVMWAWILRLCHESFHESNGPMPYSIQLTKVAEICMKASDGMQIIDLHLDTPLPFVYVHLITLLVDINTMFFVAKSAVISAIAYNDADYSRVASELLQCVIIPTLYRGLLSVAATIFDPFGDDVLDFPIGSYMDWAATCCEDVLKAQQNFPGVPQSVYNQTKAKLTGMKPSEEDPARFDSTRNKVRNAIINSFRSGKLELAVLKCQEYKRNPDATDVNFGAEPETMDMSAKALEAVSSATLFAEPIADEMKKFGKVMRGELIVLRHQVHTLYKAFAEDAVRQRDEFQKAVAFVEQYPSWSRSFSG